MADMDSYFPFWKGLTQKQQERLAFASSQKRFAKGALLHAGEGECTGLIVVKSGMLRAYLANEEGRGLTLFRLLELDICLFSASCVMNDIQFDVSVEAQEDSEVIHVPSEVYKELAESSLPVMEYTNRLMASRLSDVMWLMDQVLNKSLDSRIAAFLIEEYELRGTRELKLTHEQIGSHLGSAREVITRMLKHFQRDGLIRSGRGSIVLEDLSGLYRLAEKSLR